MRARLVDADGDQVAVLGDVGELFDWIDIPVLEGMTMEPDLFGRPGPRPVFGARHFRRIAVHDDHGATYQEIAL